MKLELGAIFEAPSWPARDVRAKPNPSTRPELTLYWEGHLSRLDTYLSASMPKEENR